MSEQDRPAEPAAGPVVEPTEGEDSVVGEPAQGRPPAEADPPPREVPAALRLRRAPRYRAFGITGVLLGIVLAAVVAHLPATPLPGGGGYSTRAVFGYFALTLGLLGAVLGLGLAVLLDRRR